jgi:hypothetical protein
LEVKQISDFERRVQQRVNENNKQGYGGALLLPPFSGLEDGDAASYQMEAQITLEGIIL